MTARHCADPALAPALARLRARGLCSYRNLNLKEPGLWRLTAAGRALRMELDLLGE